MQYDQYDLERAYEALAPFANARWDRQNKRLVVDDRGRLVTAPDNVYAAIRAAAETYITGNRGLAQEIVRAEVQAPYIQPQERPMEEFEQEYGLQDVEREYDWAVEPRVPREWLQIPQRYGIFAGPQGLSGDPAPWADPLDLAPGGQPGQPPRGYRDPRRQPIRRGIADVPGLARLGEFIRDHPYASTIGALFTALASYFGPGAWQAYKRAYPDSYANIVDIVSPDEDKKEVKKVMTEGDLLAKQFASQEEFEKEQEKRELMKELRPEMYERYMRGIRYLEEEREAEAKARTEEQVEKE